MAEKKKSEFKKEFYIKWHYSDWLNDANVRLLKPEHKGFWIDLLCQMALLFPFGHCSKLNATKLKKNLPNLKNFLVGDLVNQNSKGEVDRLIELQVELSLEQQLSISDNLEDQLHKYLPYTIEQVRYHIQALEDEDVFSRTPEGIIYSRRLVRDFRKRVVAFKNGRNGGNPSITGKTPRKKRGEISSSEITEINLVGDLVNQNPNHGVGNPVDFLVKPFPNYNYNSNKENNSTIGNLTNSETLKDGGLGETTTEQIPISADFERIASQKISVKNFSDKVDDEGWRLWAKLVSVINNPENRLEDIWKAQMVSPNDFAEIVKNHGFTEHKWLPVLKRMVSTGIKPEMKLYHRIQDYIKWVYKDQNSNGLHTGNGSYDGMQSW